MLRYIHSWSPFGPLPSIHPRLRLFCNPTPSDTHGGIPFSALHKHTPQGSFHDRLFNMHILEQVVLTLSSLGVI